MPLLDRVVRHQAMLEVGICSNKLFHIFTPRNLEHVGCPRGIGKGTTHDDLALLLVKLSKGQVGSAIGGPTNSHVLHVLVQEQEGTLIR